MQKVDVKEPISFSEAKEIITKAIKDRKENGLEPTYEQESTLKYINSFEKLNKKDSDKLIKDLVSAGLSQNIAVNVANVLPKEKEILESILTKRVEYNESKLNEIFDIISKYQ